MTISQQEFVATRRNRHQARLASRAQPPAEATAFEVVTAVALGAVTALACVAGLGDITR